MLLHLARGYIGYRGGICDWQAFKRDNVIKFLERFRATQQTFHYIIYLSALFDQSLRSLIRYGYSIIL